MKNKENPWAAFNRFEIQMPMEQAISASHSGQCIQDIQDIQDILRDPAIIAQLDNIPADKIREELKEYGAWDEEELKDDAENRLRIIWLAAGDIHEEKEEKK